MLIGLDAPMTEIHWWFPNFLGTKLNLMESKEAANRIRIKYKRRIQSTGKWDCRGFVHTICSQELGIKQHQPLILWCDNLGATYLTANLVFHARTKQLEIDYHFVQEKVALGVLIVRFISTNDRQMCSLNLQLAKCFIAFTVT